MIMRRKFVGICALTVASMLMIAGCGDKKQMDYNVSNFEGDSVKEYDNTGEVGEEAGDSDASTVTESGNEQNALAKSLGIPDSVSEDIDTAGTGLDEIKIEAAEVKVPGGDKMYTKKYSLLGYTNEDKEKLLRAMFDEETGVHNAPSETTMTEQYVDIILERKDDQLDLSADDFIGKINGEVFLAHFLSPGWSNKYGIQVYSAFGEEIPDDMKAAQAAHVTYAVADEGGEELLNDDEKKARDSLKDVDNKCSLSRDDAKLKALDYFDKLGVWDVKDYSITDTYREYRDNEYNIIQTDKYGYSIDFIPAVNGQPVYQPDAAELDTLRAKNNDEDSIDPYYVAECTSYSIGIDDKGVSSFSFTWPKKSDDEVHEVTNIMSWDEALDSLKKAVPGHFDGYDGYSSIKFDDVRLTYFMTRTDENAYEVIPVYVFAQNSSYEGEYGDATPNPVQLIMLDARDGQEVSIVQDESRVGYTPDQSEEGE